MLSLGREGRRAEEERRGRGEGSLEPGSSRPFTE